MLCTRHDVMAKEVENLKERLIELNEHWRRQISGQMEMVVPSVPRPIIDSSRLPTLLTDPSNLVGFDGPIEEVVKMVMDAGDKAAAALKIISIVGMAGSGKTALAHAVYRRLTEQNRFQCVAFVSVGLNPPHLKKTLIDLLSELANGHHSDEDINALVSRIRERLENKRYLIVVDDLWSREHWQAIKLCFPENDSLGSRIITTTRNVVLVMESDCIYNIGLLSEVDSRKLILNRAFGVGNGCPKDLEDVFNQITRRCGGLPLALVTLASVLTCQSSMGEWERIIGSTWLSISHPDVEVMKWLLNLSYNDLPPPLNQILLYLSIFPENYEVDVHRLVRLWIAEGFFFERDGRSMEEQAISGLSELFSRNMVQPLHLNHDGIPRYCRLHPVIYDFIVCKSMEAKFATVVNVQNHQYFPNNNGIIRRLSLQSNSNQDQAVAGNDYADLSCACTISIFGQASSTPHLTDLKMVHVLDLEGCVGPVCLDGLSTLLFLRYLSLRGTGVSELPATIRELRWLQALDVSSTKLKKLPHRSIGALLHLRYLNVRDTDLSELPMTIGELRYLETLPVTSTKVKELPPSILNSKHSLKSIRVGGEGRFSSIETVTRLPNAIQHCQCLEKLGTIDLRVHNASFVKAPGGLNSLRVLKITWSPRQSTEKAYREALVSSIENWIQLESLTIHCGFLCSMEFLGSLSISLPMLRKFKVTAGKFVVVPQWINRLDLLSFIQITVCKLGSDDLRILKDLPKLKCLILGLEFIPREAVVIRNDGFYRLTRFSVDCPVAWLTFRTGAMPKLTYLEPKFCSGPAGPESVPSGISNLKSLRDVVLCYNEKWCANSSSVKMTVAAVKEEVAKHRNPIELVINGIGGNVRKVEQATEIHNEAERGGEAKDDVEVAGVGTSKITSSEIEEIEDDAEHGL